MKPIVFISGPLRENTVEAEEENLKRVREIALDILEMGAVPIIPHMNFHDFCHTSGNTYAHAVGETELLLCCFEMIRRCDGVVTVDGWELSVGSKSEVSYAKDLRLPVHNHMGNLDRLHDFVQSLSQRALY